MADDIVAKLGLDTSTFAQALRGAGRLTDSFAMSIRKSFTNLGATALGAIGLGALTSLGKSAVDFASNLNDVSENLGVTTDFLQDFTFIMGQAGVNTQLANRSLEFFSRRIGESREGTEAALKIFAKYGLSLKNADGSLRSTEQILFDVADKMKGTRDATEQSAIAFDFFGKSSARLVGQLKQGSEAFKELRASVPKLSQEEISQLDQFGDAWTRLGTKVKIAAGQFITAFLNLNEVIAKVRSSTAEQDLFQKEVDQFGFYSAIGRRTARMEAEQNVERWTREMRARKAAFDAAQSGGSEPGAPAIDPDVAEKQLKFAKEVNSEDERRISNLKRLVDKMHEQEDAQKRLNDSQKELKTARADQSRFTLQELAELQGRGRFGLEAQGARNVLLLQQRAKLARQLNRPALADALQERANNIRGQLTNVIESERFPFKGLEKNTLESAEALRRISGAVIGDGKSGTKLATQLANG